MSTKIIHKKTAVSGRLPTTSQLDLGEIGINTYDGTLHIKKDDGTASIITIGQISTIDDIGDVDLTGIQNNYILKWDSANSKFVAAVDATGTTINSLGDIGDVDLITNSPSDGQTIIWDSANSEWIPGTPSTVAAINDLTDVDTQTTAPTNGQALVWDSANSEWVPGTVATSGSISWLGGNIEGAVFTYTIGSDTTTVSGADDNANTLYFNGTAVTVYVNGVRLVNGDDYTASSGTTITFQETVFSGSVVEVIANESLNSDEVSISTTNATAVYTASATKVRSVKLIIQMSHSTGGYHVTEVLVIHNGSTTYDTEYGTIFSSASLGTVSSQINGGNLEVLVTPVSANTDVRCKVLSIDI